MCLWLLSGLVGRAQPDNDRFIQRQALTGEALAFGAYLLDATVEAGEPVHPIPFGFPTRSVWYTWTAPGDGFVRVRVVSWAGEPVAAAVYTGTRVNQLVPAGAATDGATGYFPVTAGLAYQIAAYTYQSGGLTGYVEAELDLDFLPAPANDAFAGRLPLKGAELVVIGANVGATREPTEPAVGTDRPPHTVWWSWTAPSNGNATVTFRNLYFGVRAAAYTGAALGQLALVASNSPVSALPLNFAARAGETYHLMVGSVIPGYVGRFTMDLVLSSWRLTSPPEGTRLAAPGRLTFRWVDVPGNGALRNLQAVSGQGIIGWWPELSPEGLALENLRAGSYSVRLVGTDDLNRYHVTPPVNFSVAVLNDHFAQRELLQGTVLDAAGTLQGATVEPGEPGSEPSVWWTWVPPFSGRAVIGIQGGARFDLFTGESMASLQRIVPAVDVFDRAEFDVIGGVAVQIRAGAKHEWSSPGFHLQLLTPPSNDLFAGRIAILTNRVNLVIPIGLAGVDPTEPALLANPDQATVWYTWTAPSEGVIGFGGGASDGYYGYAIFTGDSTGSLQRVAGPAFGVVGSLFDPVPGTTYQLAVIGHRSNPGTLTFFMEFKAAPANDRFAKAQPISGVEGQIAGNNELATVELGEPPHHGQESAKSVWYAWTAPRSGLIELFATTDPPPGYAFDPVVAIYGGSSLGSLVSLGSGIAKANAPAYANVEAGQAYRIAVAGTAYSPNSDFELHWRLHDRPINDSFAKRIPLAGLRPVFQGVNFGATREPGEPAHGGSAIGRSVWWSWTAPYSGWAAIVSLGDGSFPARLLIYEGDALASLKLVGDSLTTLPGLNLSAVLFEATAGKTYQLVLDTSGDLGGPGGNYELNLDLSTLRLTSPAEGSIHTATAPVTLELNTPLASVDGTLSWVDFRSLDFTSPTLGPSLGVVTKPPFRIVQASLPPARYLVMALATNLAGELRVSLPATFRVRPANDDFAARLPLTGRSLLVNGTAAGAGRELGEPSHSPATNAPTVWYSWTAPADGLASSYIQEGGGTVRVYRGNAVHQLVAVTGESPGGNFSATRGGRYEIAVLSTDPSALAPGYTNGFALRLGLETMTIVKPAGLQHVVSGAPLLIEATTTERSGDLSEVEFRVDGVRIGGVSTAPYRFTWNSTGVGQHSIGVRARLAAGGFTEETLVAVVVVSANDDFAGRTMIASGASVFRGNTLGATAEAGGPYLAQGDLWFAWRAPMSGRLVLDGSASSYWPRLAVFRGTTLQSLVLLADDVSYFRPEPIRVQVEAGVDYAFAVDGRNFQSGAFEYSLRLQQAPPNDDFENRVVLSGSAGNVRGSLDLATAQAGEPSHGGVAARHTAWWSWIAPGAGTLRITAGLGDWLRLGAYTGTSLPTLVPVPVISQGGSFDLNVQVGMTYQFAFSDWSGSIGDFTWDFTITPPPANDNFSSRTPLFGRQIKASGTLRGATHEAGEPRHPSGSGFGSVWWTWTALADGHVRILLSVYGFDPLVGVYRGSTLGQLAPVVSGNSGVEFEATAGTSYQIAIDRSTASSGDVQIQLALDYPPANDDFARRTFQAGEEWTAEGWNNLAGREYLEPRHAGRYGGRSVWFAWRAPDWGLATLETTSTFYPSLVAAYRGSSLADLVPEAARVGGVSPLPSGLQGTNQIQFAVSRGTEYAIAVDGQSGGIGDFALQFHFVAGPAPFGFMVDRSVPGNIHLNLVGLAGRIAEVQTSTDLASWDLLMSTPAGAETYEFDVPVGTNESGRFFRGVIPAR